MLMTSPDFPISGTPSAGELALEDRAALRRVAGLSTELADVSEVEYRQLRLERVVLVGVWTEGSAADADASMAELAALAETAGSEVLEGLIQRRDKPDPSTYIGSGKAQELRDVVAATGADTVICDGELSPAQLNALEKAVKVKVIDRTALILDIFAQHATSREGKAQVALAQMEYMLPRLRGWGESMSRQAGGAPAAAAAAWALRGPGETKIETDRRRIRERMSKLRREIKDMKKVRDTQRSRRLGSEVAVGRDRRLHQRRQVQPAQRAHRRRRAGGERVVRHAGTHHAPWRIRRRPAVRADRHRRIRPPSAHPAGRGVPVDAGGGRRRRSAGARRRRLRCQPAGADQRGAPGVQRGDRRVTIGQPAAGTVGGQQDRRRR